MQPNYSTVGGDLASASLSDAYYPASNRPGLVLEAFIIDTSERIFSNMMQEFVLSKLTSRGKNRKWSRRGIGFAGRP